MANFNKVFLMGNLTRDPELRYTQSGMAVTDFGLAINRSYTGKDGVKKDSTVFVDVVVWARRAEVACEFLSKGRPVFVEGRLQYDTWEKDGQKRSTLEVIADSVKFLSSRSSAPAKPKEAPQEEYGAERSVGTVDLDGGEEIPF